MGSGTVTHAITIGTLGLAATTGTSPFNGSAAVTIDIDTTKVPRLLTNTNTFAASTGATTLVVRQGATQTTVNLMEWQNTTPTALALVTSGGSIFSSANGGFGSTSALSTARLSVSAAASSIGVIVRGNATTPGNLQEWQNSGTTVLASVSSTGVIATTGLTLSSTTSPVTLNATVGTTGQVLSSAGAGATPAWRDGPVDGTTSTGTTGFGFMGLPQNATTTGAYTVVAADAGKHIYASATRTVTINSNTNLALPIGTTLTFIAGSGATMTIAITTDTMYLAGPGTTGSRTLAPFGMATAVKITATTWMISGNGLT